MKMANNNETEEKESKPEGYGTVFKSRLQLLPNAINVLDPQPHVNGENTSATGATASNSPGSQRNDVHTDAHAHVHVCVPLGTQSNAWA